MISVILAICTSILAYSIGLISNGAYRLMTADGDCNAPILTDTDTSLQRIYVGQNCPHVYTLSIKYNTDSEYNTKRGIFIYANNKVQVQVIQVMN